MVANSPTISDANGSYAEFAGYAAVVTGAASGIGASISKLLSTLGVHVLLLDRNVDKLGEMMAGILESGGQASSIPIDITNPMDISEALDHPVLEKNKLKFAVNSAGIDLPRQSTGEYRPDIWKQVIDVNLSGVFYSMRYVIPHMIKAGGGSIVNISSVMGHRAIAGQPAYTAAKHGVLGLTKAAALDHAKDGIRINSVAPGCIKTPLLGFLSDEQRDAAAHRQPMGRLGEASEIAETILYLLSDRASFVTGSCFDVDGGFLAG